MKIKSLDRPEVDIYLSVAVVFLVVLFDRLTKIFFSNILAEGESLPIIRNILHMTLVHNTGIAFGLFKGQDLVFIVVPVIAIVLLVYNIYYYKYNNEKLSRLYIVAISLILGGAIGNLVDRIQHGYVIDFIDFQVWPVFNVADSAITIGAVIIALNCISQTTTHKT